MTTRLVNFVLYDHAQDNQPKQMKGYEASDVFTLFSEHDTTNCYLEGHEGSGVLCTGKKCPGKDGQNWSPGWIPPGGKRGSDYVTGLDFLVYDLDHITPPELEHVFEAFDDKSVLVHSSHSHRFPDNICIRVVLELSRTVTPKEHLLIWHAAIRKYQLPMETGKKKRGVDLKCKDPSHFYFTPRAPRGAESINVRNDEDGQPLDVEALLAEARAFKPAPPAPVSSPPPEAGALDTKGHKALLARYRGRHNDTAFEREEKMEYLRRVRTGEALAELGDRDSAVYRVARMLPWILPLGTPVEAAMELIRPSVAAMPTSPEDKEDENVDGWMAKAAKNYEKGMGERLAKDAENKSGTVFLRTLTPTSGSRAPSPPEDGGGGGDGGDGGNDGGGEPEGDDGDGDKPEDPLAWRGHCLTTINIQAQEVLAQVGVNVRNVLEHHPAWRGVLRFNDVTKDIECFGGPLTEKEKDPTVIDTAVGNWLQQTDKVNLNLQPAVVRDQMLLVAMQNRFDPIQDYLNSLTWDGIPRIYDWLITHCGARVVNDRGEDITNYVRQVSAKWLIGAVARALRPGEQVDNVLVFEGKQGRGKSRTLRALGGEWFTDTTLKLEGNSTNARQTAGSVWFAELAELATLRQSETDQQKAFLSAIDDFIRIPYAKRPMRFFRRCVFGGSTNPEDTGSGYLRDGTGNRRYWPVYCDWFKVADTKRDRNQLFAEAVVRLKEGEKWYFEGDLDNEMVESETNQRLDTGSYGDTILSWWCGKEIADRPERFQLRDVALNALGLAVQHIKNEQNAIGRALKKLGFRPVKHRVDGLPLNYYAPNEALRNHPKVEKDPKRKHLSVVPPPKPSSPPVPKPSSPKPEAKA